MWNYTIKIVTFVQGVAAIKKQIKNDSISNGCEKVVKKLKNF